MAIPAFEIGPKAISESANVAEPTSAAARDAVLPTYKRSIEMARGEGVYLIDTEGNRYLDFVSGIAVNSLGYGDAGLVSTMQRAAEGLVHVSNLYWTAPAAELAARLVERSFAAKVFFANSGAEANEGAFKFAPPSARPHP